LIDTMTTLFIIKVITSALVIGFVSEIAKRSTPLAAIIAGFPLTSLLTFFWLYVETKSTEKFMPLSWQIVLASIPSLMFLSILAICLKKGVGIGPSMIISFIVLLLGQLGYIFLLQRLQVKIY